MENRIRALHPIRERSDPAEAELRLAIYPELLNAGTQIKGRLMGPICPYAATVEVAYHAREVARADDHIVVRVVVPEPCLWEPQRPFLYAGPIELWQDGRRHDQRRFSHAWRELRRAGDALRINGKHLGLKSRSHPPADEDEARRWHEEGINALVLDGADDETRLLADRFGFAILPTSTAV